MRVALRRPSSGGFTLVELMVVVAIVGLLAATAIPSFTKYVRRAKTTEVVMNLKVLFDGAVTFHRTERADASGKLLLRRFPDDARTNGGWRPAYGRCCKQVGQKCAPDPREWTGETWQQLSFSIDVPHHYSYIAYGWFGDGSHSGDTFAVRGDGDLDCDGFYSNYWRTITVDASGAARGGAAITVYNDVE